MFRRSMGNNGDVYDNPIGDDTRIIFAFHPSTNELRYHGPTRSSSVIMNFQSDCM